MKKDNPKNFEIHNNLNVAGASEESLTEIVNNILDLDDIGFAGFLEREGLKTLLKGFIFDKNKKNQPYLYDPKYEEEIEKICSDIFNKCKKYIDKKTHIFLFPTFDKFVVDKMGGVNGFSSWDNTILIFINFVGNWKEHLRETILHELAHALSPFYKGADFPIGYALVLEGMAEHFKDYIVPNKRSPWTQAISEEKAFEIFYELKHEEILGLKDFDKHHEIFYGTGKYAMWTGYTIGYYLVKKYLQKQKEISWNDFLRKNPEEILKEIR